jgi:hypothetical protein
MEVHYIYTYEDSIMKSYKCCLEKGRGGRERMGLQWRHKHAQGTLYAYMGLSRWNDNSKVKI